MAEESFALSTTETDLVKALRQEANEVKECFTRFSFQALAFSAAIFGLIGRFEDNHLFAALGSTAIVVLLLLVARIGTYKYGTANRHFGYELHLYRVRYLQDHKGSWRNHMRQIGWEEAMQAWRVVQTTAFREIYYTHPMLPNWLHLRHRRCRKENPAMFWLEPGTAVVSGPDKAVYHAGTYLRDMLVALHLLAFISTIPFVIIFYRLHTPNRSAAYAYASFGIVLLLVILLRVIKDRTRRKLLEEGFLSIHSCAIMWQAVVLAHYRALGGTKTLEAINYDDYFSNLATQAQLLKKHIFQIKKFFAEEEPQSMSVRAAEERLS